MIGTALAIVGLALTWVQARQAKEQAQGARTASEAAALSLDRAQRQLRGNLMLNLVPQLRFIAAELDLSIESGSPEQARRHLDHWRSQANHLHGVLKDEVPEPRSLLRQLNQSVAFATEAETNLISNPDKSVVETCVQVRKEIGNAMNLLAQRAGRQVSHVPADIEEQT